MGVDLPTAPSDSGDAHKYLNALMLDFKGLGFPVKRSINTLTGLIENFADLSNYIERIRESNPETNIGKSIQYWARSIDNRNPFHQSGFWMMCAKAEPLFIKCVEDAEDSDKHSPIIIFDGSGRATGLIKPDGEPTLYIFGDKSEPSIDTIGSSVELNDMFGNRIKPPLLEKRAGAYAIKLEKLGQIFNHRPSILSVPGEVRIHLKREVWDPYKDRNVSIGHTSQQLFDRCQWLLEQSKTKVIKPKDLL